MSGVTTATLVAAAAATAAVGTSLHTANKAKKQAKKQAAIAQQEPVQTEQATQDVIADQQKTKSKRANLFKTGGGVSGEELQAGQVKQRATLLGN